jgi:hypothetical protein
MSSLVVGVSGCPPLAVRGERGGGGLFLTPSEVSDRGRYVDQPSGDPPFMLRPRQFGSEDHPLSEQPNTLFEARTGETWSIYD